MSVSITTTPTLVIPGRATKISFSTTTGNYVKLWLTACPPTSEWYAGFHGGAIAQQLVGEQDADKQLLITFDVPGVYTFSAQEITKGASTYGGAYAGDPDSYDTLTILASSSVSVNVGQRMRQQVGAAADTAQLYAYTWGTAISATTETSHGEATPRLDDWSSEKARLACQNATVVTKVAAMTGTITTLIGATATFLDELITKFNAHRTQAGVHAANDTDNAVDTSFKVGTASTSAERMGAALAELETRLLQHMTNDSGTGPGSAAADYHTAADNKRVSIADGPGDMRSVIIKLADLRRVYDAHRAEGATIHAAADSTNTLTTGSALLQLHEQLMAQLASTSLTGPATEHAGVTSLIASGGFEKA